MKPRLLIVELHHLGDAVLSLPFLRGAQETYEVHVLCRPATRPVYDMLPQPPKLHLFEPPWADETGISGGSSIASARIEGKVLRPLEFSAGVSAWADARVELLLAETRAERRIGFPMTHGNYYAAGLPWRRKRRWLGRLVEGGWRSLHPRTPLLTHRLHRASSGQSHLQCWEQIAECLGVTCDYGTPWLNVGTTTARADTGRPLLAVHTRARLPSKQWPEANWREVLGHPGVCERFDIVEILPPGATPLAADLASPCVTEDLPALAGALHAADAVLCHDSLPAHLAAALDKPVVAIFGSGEPDWFAPWRNRHRVVQRRVCPMHPCIDRCGMDRYLCLESIPVEDVVQRLGELSFPA